MNQYTIKIFFLEQELIITHFYFINIFYYQG